MLGLITFFFSFCYSCLGSVKFLNKGLKRWLVEVLHHVCINICLIFRDFKLICCARFQHA